ncbi:preprotein translocase subunit SecG [bacterium]|nr:preprotein translocase subunit SecG [bacterium]
MYTLLMILFIILSFFLSVFVLIQQGKGDLGASTMSGSHMLFGGSGGQTFFERTTWILGALFIAGALCLSIMKAKQQYASILEGVVLPKPAQPVQTARNIDIEKLANDLQQEATTETTQS